LANDFQHAPYAEGSCDVCHAGGNQMQAAGLELCTTCHSDHEGDAELTVTHAPLTSADGCLACHQPHTGRTKTLLMRESTSETCMACHERGMFENEFKHPDVAECTTCHAPHGGEQGKLLVEKQVDLCMTCHDDAAERHTHVSTGPSKDPRTGEELACASCHDPHSSAHEMQLTHEKSRELCVQCHRGQNLKVRGRTGAH
jgi:predicted CXXCH cytochrome family protein